MTCHSSIFTAFIFLRTTYILSLWSAAYKLVICKQTNKNQQENPFQFVYMPLSLCRYMHVSARACRSQRECQISCSARSSRNLDHRASSRFFVVTWQLLLLFNKTSLPNLVNQDAIIVKAFWDQKCCMLEPGSDHPLLVFSITYL